MTLKIHRICLGSFFVVFFLEYVTSFTVTSGLSAVGVDNGGFTELTVTVDPANGVTGYWSRIDLAGNEQQINTDGVNYVVEALKLTIFSFHQGLAGLYVYRASDSINHAQNDPITVYERGSPTVSTTMSEELVTIGQSIILHCNVISGDVIADIKWMHAASDGTSTFIDESDSSRYSGSLPDSPSLELLSVSAADLGDYWCYAEDINGKTGISEQIKIILKTDAAGDSSTINTSLDTLFNIDTSTEFTETLLETTMSSYFDSMIELSSSYLVMNGGTSQQSTFYTTELAESTLDTLQLISSSIKPSETSLGSILSIVSSQYQNSIIATDSMSSERLFSAIFGSSQSISSLVVLTDTMLENVSSVVSFQYQNGTTATDSVSSERLSSATNTEVIISPSSTVTQINSVVTYGFTMSQNPDEMCPCDCEYQAKLDYWATQNLTQYTMEELRIILRPVLDEIEKNLRVNKKNLSSTIRKLTSATDKRPVAKQIGSIGIIFMIFIISTILAADLLSLKQHITQVLMIWNIKLRK